MNKTQIDEALVSAGLFALAEKDPGEYRALVEFAERYARHYSLLRSLDDEQQVACLARGRTVVSAGAGSGKTFTLQTRLRVLLSEGQDPARVVVVTFNRAAAQEIRDRVADLNGSEQLVIGTMHSIFGRYVGKYGSKAEKEAIDSRLISDESRSNRAPSLRQFSGILWRTWEDCKDEEPPRSIANVIQRWQVLGYSPEQARASALTLQEEQASFWFEWWQGFRGFLGPTWQPPCETAEGKKRWAAFLARWRPESGVLLGELNDMILLFDRLLQRTPQTAREIANGIDHLLIDEAQDLNTIQHRIVDTLAAAGVPDVWIVGDERQSINAFVGASPELFADLPKRGYSLHAIATNYRSEPEIVQLANALMAEHDTTLNIDSRPDPAKGTGRAELRLLEGSTHEDAALRVIGRIRQRLAEGAMPQDFAVLARTNLELDAYESACLLASVPYTRRASQSFLRSPEVLAVRGYLDVIVSGEVDAVASILDKPARFFLRQDEAPIVLEFAVKQLASGEEFVSVEQLFSDEGLTALLEGLQSLKTWASYQTKSAEQELERLGRAVLGMRRAVLEDSYTTRRLLDELLTLDGAPKREGRKRPTLAETLLPFGGDDYQDVSVADTASAQPLGSLDFLFALLDGSSELNKPKAFVAHLADLEENGNELSYSGREWQDAQAMLPVSQRQPIPAVTLSTVHSVKGLQWVNVAVVMGPSVFPWKGPPDVPLNDLAKPKLFERARRDLRTERQLAYVAWTRAKRALWIVSPARSAYGRAGERSEFLGGQVAPLLEPHTAALSTWPELSEIITATRTFSPQRVQVQQVKNLDENDTALLRQFGITVQQSMTVPTKANKEPRKVWTLAGRTAEHADVLKSAGGRLYDRAWSFYEDPTEKIASVLRLKLGSTEEPDEEPDEGNREGFDPTVALKLVADSWDRLRAVDLPRLLDDVKSQGSRALSKFVSVLKDQRQDLVDKINEWRDAEQDEGADDQELDDQTEDSEDKQTEDKDEQPQESAARTLARFRLQVVETMTTPKKAGKQPKKVWNVQGLTAPYEEFLRDAGGHRFKGVWSFWDDPTEALVSRLRAEGVPSAERRADYRAGRSQRRAERLEARAEKQSKEASTRFATARRIGDAIPFGQPILVGHHSERHHRRDINRIDTNMRKGSEAYEAAQDLARRAATAAENAEQNWSVRYLAERIREREADLRRLDRYDAQYPTRGVEQRQVDRARLKDEIAFYQRKIDEQGGIKYGPDDIAVGDLVNYRGTWYPVRRVNKKTVTIGRWLGIEKFTWTPPYSEISDVKKAGAPVDPEHLALVADAIKAASEKSDLGRLTVPVLNNHTARRVLKEAEVAAILRSSLPELSERTGLALTLNDAEGRFAYLTITPDRPLNEETTPVERPQPESKRVTRSLSYDPTPNMAGIFAEQPAAERSQPISQQLQPEATQAPAPTPKESEQAERAADEVCDPERQVCELGLLGGLCGIKSVLLVRDGGNPTTIPARYCLGDIINIIPSHASAAYAARQSVPIFSSRKDYPERVQERRYDQQSEALKVERIAQNLVPEEIVSLVSNPLTGPPIVTAQGWALGGNGRTMGIDGYYYNNPAPNKLTAYLESVASQFGFEPSDVSRYERPVIMRVVDTLAGRNRRKASELTEQERNELVWLVRVTNQTTAQGLDPVSAAVSQARALDADTIQALADGLGEQTLSEFFDGNESSGFVLRLVRSGILPSNEPAWFASAKKLSAQGKQLVERMLAARLLPDAEVLETGEELRRSLAQLAPYLLAAQEVSPDFGLAALIPAAVKDWLTFKNSGVTLENYFRQGSLLGPKMFKWNTDERHNALVAFLAENMGRYRVLAKAAQAYLRAAKEAASPQVGMFSSTKEPESSAVDRIFRQTFGPKG